MSSVRPSPLPASLVKLGREAVLWFNAIAGRSAAANPNASPSLVVPAVGYSQAQFTQVVADLNAAITTINNLQNNFRASGQLQE